MINRQQALRQESHPQVAQGSVSFWRLSSLATLLFYAFTVYLVIPIADVPLLGLSLSAPIFFLITMEVFARLKPSIWKRYTRWIVFAYVFWFGLLLSLAGNVLLGNITDFGTRDVLNIVRWAYWVLVFVVTTVIVSSDARLTQKTTQLLGIAIIVVAFLRLGEALLFGRWGNATSRIFTQNTYGWLFSAFTPYGMLLLYKARRWQRLVALVAAAALFTAIAGNGSRSSWIAATIGVLVFLVLYALTQKAAARTLWLPVAATVLVIVTISIVPEHVVEPVQQRFETFEELDTDKSYLIRQLMIQKSVTMFTESPLIGKGIWRFRSTDAPLNIPHELHYGSEHYFNRKSPHNSYAALLGETGLAGTVPYGILLLMLTISGARAGLRLARRGEIWAIAVYAGFIGASIHFWTLSGLTGTVPWFIYGLVAGMIQLDQSTHDGMTHSRD